MGSDLETLRAVVSWACGFLTLMIIGIGVPVLVSFMPDAIDVWRRQGRPQPILVTIGLIVGLTIVGAYEATLTGSPGTPGTVLWLTFTILLAAGVGLAALCFTADRALRRRRERRYALDAATEPPALLRTEPHRESKPAPVERLNSRGAELLARDWMRYLGATDATETRERRDGGVDVRSREFVAQVKHLQNEQVGVAAVRQLYGVATAEQRRAVFFSSSGYTRDALAFARENDVALFVVRYREGHLVPHGALAQQYKVQGLRVVTPH